MWRQRGLSRSKYRNFESLVDSRKNKKMKEYKVVTLKLGFRNRTQNFEDLLNQYAREGWTLKEVPVNWNSIILERDKNR